VAAALAVQNVLTDVIASLSMYLDRPFDIGDFIIVGDYMGTVTKIGVRTTRVQALGGEELIFPNGDLARSRIQNYARMSERRVVFGFGIEYGLHAEKLDQAAQLARQIVTSLPNVRFDRAHFKSYGAYSLDYEVVYYVLSSDYNQYMDVQHTINLQLYQQFERAEIPFAFPTRTLFMRRSARSLHFPDTATEGRLGRTTSGEVPDGALDEVGESVVAPSGPTTRSAPS
jgi:small-conductance mechanosensitive channel